MSGDDDRLAVATAEAFAASLDAVAPASGLIEVVGATVIVDRALEVSFRDVECWLGPPLVRAAAAVERVMDQVQDVFAELTADPWPLRGKVMPEPSVTVAGDAIHVTFSAPGQPTVAMPPIRLSVKRSATRP